MPERIVGTKCAPRNHIGTKLSADMNRVEANSEVIYTQIVMSQDSVNLMALLELDKARRAYAIAEGRCRKWLRNLDRFAQVRALVGRPVAEQAIAVIFHRAWPFAGVWGLRMDPIR